MKSPTATGPFIHNRQLNMDELPKNHAKRIKSEQVFILITLY